MTKDSTLNLESLVRGVPNYPVEGIYFRDITPLIAHPQAFRQAIDIMAEPYKDKAIDVVVGIEAQGFIFASALAMVLNAGVVTSRKKGKMPFEKIEVEYSLEYGTDKLYMHKDAIKTGMTVLIADDVLATGGTASAVGRLVGQLNGIVTGYTFLIELQYLPGRQALSGLVTSALVFGKD